MELNPLAEKSSVTMRYFLKIVTVTMRYSLKIVTVTMSNLFLFKKANFRTVRAGKGCWCIKSGHCTCGSVDSTPKNHF